MIENGNIIVYDYDGNSGKFLSVGIFDSAESVSYEWSAFNVGQFSLQTRDDVPNANLLTRGRVVRIGGKATGIITTRKETLSQDGRVVVAVTGYDLRILFKQRIIRNLNSDGKWEMSGNAETVLLSLIESECGSLAQEKRRLPVSIPVSQSRGEPVTVSESFTNLLDVCQKIALQGNIGWCVELSDGLLSLKVYTGEDKSGEVFISPAFGTIASGEWSDSSDSFSNAVYIGGKGNNGARDVFEGEENDARGLMRFESFANESSLTTTQEYRNRADMVLSQYEQTEKMSGQMLFKSPYVFGDDYFVADILTVEFRGHKSRQQITGYTESYQRGKYAIKADFGHQQMTIGNQLSAVANNLKNLSEQVPSNSITSTVTANFTGGTWTQNKNEIKYDTIDVNGAGKLILYYDASSKTGRKGYNLLPRTAGTLKLCTTADSTEKTLAVRAGFCYRAEVTDAGAVLVDEASAVRSYAESVQAYAETVAGRIPTVVDTVQAGNYNPVTSNAVAGSIPTVVDTVQAGNYNPVTSNAVAGSLTQYNNASFLNDRSHFISLTIQNAQPFSDNFLIKINSIVYLTMSLQNVARGMQYITTLPQGYRPITRQCVKSIDVGGNSQCNLIVQVDGIVTTECYTGNYCFVVLAYPAFS